jgi:hypothetical protein
MVRFAAAFVATFFGAARLAAAFFGAARLAMAFFAAPRAAFFGAATFLAVTVFFATARLVAFVAAFFGAAFAAAALVAFFGATFLAVDLAAAFLVAALTANAIALSLVVIASVVTCRNSLFAVVEDAGYSRERRYGRFRNMRAPRGRTATNRRVRLRQRTMKRGDCIRCMAIAQALRCAADVDAHAVPASADPTPAGVVRIEVSGTQWASFPSALLRDRLRSPRTRLRPIDRAFPVTHTFRYLLVESRIGQACAYSAIRASIAHVNKKRPLLALIGRKNCTAASPRRPHRSNGCL